MSETIVLTKESLAGVMKLRRSGERTYVTGRWGEKLIADDWFLEALALAAGKKVVDSSQPWALMSAHAMPLQCFRPCVSKGCVLCRGHEGECVMEGA